MAIETAPLFVPTPGAPELLIILFVAILLFGANKIPKLARSTGEAMGEFQKGREKVETELEEMRESDFKEEIENEDDDDFVDTEPVTEEGETETETETN
ncbi:twin-arginine translocation protein, TatA/E family subunit [Haloterrigena turkmenica DSM 5511]|uniref:Twin-arginine translocation protein, TatA/E family subunit n=1 Tax=Haloterrigena turkmenica (strain ATCC 51198 / DSM 5511 / JCM 9101 / NCIMB 13204 / VKM B-1734 / 4k) TaxID=543526 RepID=D2RYD5_HALTV|nr:twin-arginine translocase TatA/TatE family subunit [Haloterrigena turkmenica]ADB59836.1 twin-arginine translocation protein, TatA/E family subunit [Haloterrigena turkmenica DSM 5511]